MNAFKVKKIQKDSLGGKLECARVNKGWSIIDAYEISKIPTKYLEFLEQEEWNKLPGKIYVKNFLKKYCSCLGLNYKLCIREYEKQSSKKINKKNIDRGFLKKTLESITPRKFTMILLIVGVIGFMGYIGYEIFNYIKPPEIFIISPEKEFTTMEGVLNISGKTEAESTLSVNGEAVGVSQTGDFSFDVNLKSGLNKFELVAQKKHSRKSFEQIVIYKKD